jgi:hypothetical protein
MKKIFTLLAFLSLATTTLATTRFVKPLATDTGDGSSWTHAPETLNSILLLSQSGDKVWVVNRPYLPTNNRMSNSAPTNIFN